MKGMRRNEEMQRKDKESKIGEWMRRKATSGSPPHWQYQQGRRSTGSREPWGRYEVYGLHGVKSCTSCMHIWDVGAVCIYGLYLYMGCMYV